MCRTIYLFTKIAYRYALLVQYDVSILSKGKGVERVSAYRAQEFLRVYDVLRRELIVDDLIAAQPKFSADYMNRED